MGLDSAGVACHRVGDLGRLLVRAPATWIAAAIVVVDLRAASVVSELAWMRALCFTAGAVALLLLQAASTPATARVFRMVVVLFALVQLPVLFGEWLAGHYFVGLTGVTRYTAALLAVAVPLAPLWGLPLLALGLLITQSYLAIGAALAGLLVTRRWPRAVVGSWILAALFLVAILGSVRSENPQLLNRLEVWASLLPDLLQHPWVGLGPDGWGTTVPIRQITRSDAGAFAQPHSELIGWVFEEGLVGLGLLVAWLLTMWRRLWASPERGACVTIALLAAGLHIFHSVILVPFLLLVLAGAQAEPA